MAQQTAQGGVCRTCKGKGFVVKQTSCGNQRVTCKACLGSKRAGYTTK